jgi:uncharacterized protein YecT (DUF1311 family)
VIAELAILMAALGEPTGGEGVPTFRDPPACWDGSQHELNVCAWKEFQQADKAMNEQWNKTAALMKRLDADDPPIAEIGQSSNYEALLNGQRAWLQFRDDYCPIFGTGGGSMKPMLIDLCHRDVTRARIEQLKSLMLNPATGNSYYEDQ